MPRFEWDEAKNASNLKKHGVDFDTAKLMFDDPNHIAFVESIIDGEQRWQAIGVIPAAVLLVVVHTYRDGEGEEVIRMISARQATKHERKLYAAEAF